MPSDDTPGRRAPRQSTDERRAMIVQAAIPLLVEIGPSVTTLQIARAAGISEPTIFRAFADKNELLAACLTEITDPRHVVDELDAIDPGSPLRDRLVALIEAIRAQGERTGAVVNAVSLAGTGRPRREDIPDEERVRLSERRTASWTRLRARTRCGRAPHAGAGHRRPGALDRHVPRAGWRLGRRRRERHDGRSGRPPAPRHHGVARRGT